jgi:hypothetical protein
MKEGLGMHSSSLRCATTLLCGWLLMTPTIASKEPDLDLATLKAMEVPIGQWEQFQSFDSASDCEEMRLKMMRLWFRKENPRYVATFTNARCLPVEAISLK